ncbi:MAG TPA: ADP-ribose pyrophosphatase [Cryomorphaceae bacterium]|mgnify:CR=1 FL=1|nr:ADP-ribose pyrophosphatase [Owenweeksia sp.]MBF99351.1 ADP-ribose pyrophosphatase [Owenweeksia sp.]HAD98191.1 ADP-ribose pyrophosphatase [Cryomorphaceae bacterium]HBF20377.1 ADP-ribose pyrophosphatase [Cryomorphaceae bacterium]
MKYCSECGHDILDYRIPKGDHTPRYVCTSCHIIHYQNPNMVVGCLIVNDGRIMLARRGIEPRKGYWNLPCGFLENEETVQQGAKREVFEETGASVELGPLHTVYNLPHANQVYLIFLATMTDPHYHLTDESTEIGFFAPDEIPWDEIAFSSNAFALKKYLENGEGKPHPTYLGSYFKDKIR